MYTVPGILGLLALFLSVYLLFLSVSTMLERPVRYGVFVQRAGVFFLVLLIAMCLLYLGFSLSD